jgi:hypothetical protein
MLRGDKLRNKNKYVSGGLADANGHEPRREALATYALVARRCGPGLPLPGAEIATLPTMDVCLCRLGRAGGFCGH